MAQVIMVDESQIKKAPKKKAVMQWIDENNDVGIHCLNDIFRAEELTWVDTRDGKAIHFNPKKPPKPIADDQIEPDEAALQNVELHGKWTEQQPNDKSGKKKITTFHHLKVVFISCK